MGERATTQTRSVAPMSPSPNEFYFGGFVLFIWDENLSEFTLVLCQKWRVTDQNVTGPFWRPPPLPPLPHRVMLLEPPVSKCRIRRD